MAKLSFKVGDVYCYDCVEAVRKFVEKMKGVRSVNVENNESVVIEYEPSTLEFTEERFRDMVKETVEKLGFKIKGF